jgi:hypothetical protein
LFAFYNLAATRIFVTRIFVLGRSKKFFYPFVRFFILHTSSAKSF